MVSCSTLDVQLHDPARGGFDPTFDRSFSMMTGTRPMRPGKTASDRGDTTLRITVAETLAEYMAEYKPATSREYGSRVKTRFRKNLAAGLIA